jgi:Arc/MetJ family transcription regulator
MRTTLVIDERLLKEAKSLSGAKSKKEAVEKALDEFIKKRKAKKLLELEGRVELSFSLEELLDRRKKDVPDR